MKTNNVSSKAVLYLVQGALIAALYVVLTILAQGICILPVRFWQEERQKRVLRQAFSR